MTGIFPVCRSAISALAFCVAWLSGAVSYSHDTRSETWSEATLQEADDLARKIGTASAVLLHDRKQAFSYGSLSRKYKCHSICKVLLSSLYGICAERGTIDLEAHIGELNVEEPETPFSNASVSFDDIERLLKKLLAANPAIQSLLISDQEHSAAILSELKQDIDDLRKRYHIPGLSMVVVKDGRVILSDGLGYADVANQRLVTDTTPFHIASLSKPFAAALTMKLVEQDKLDIDTPISQLLDKPFNLQANGFEDYDHFCRELAKLLERPGRGRGLQIMLRDFDCENPTMTLRHFLSHTSHGTPGDGYRYNGFLFSMITPVLERHYEDDYPHLLASNIIEPLSMDDTYPQLEDGRNQAIMANRATPYRVDADGNSEISDFPRGLSASAGIVSTVLDLAEFDAALDQGRINPEEFRERCFTPTQSNSGEALPYGLGWFSQTHLGRRVVWHYGHQPHRYSSLYVKVPDSGLTLILLANSGGLSAPFSLGRGDVTRSPFAKRFLDAVFSDTGTKL